jgi:hypothetical protein
MQPFNVYKHINCYDIGFQPTKIKLENGIYIVNGVWHNLNYKFVIDVDVIHIKEEDINKWELIENV